MMNNLLPRTNVRRFLLLVIALACMGSLHAQTTLVSPSGAGGFELGTGSLSDNGWTVVAGSPNSWYTGSGKTSGLYSFPSTSRCAYVSNDAGTTWAYASAAGANNKATHFYRDIVFPAGETNVTLSFKFQQNGNNARFLVYMCDTTLTPVQDYPQPGSNTVGAGNWGPTAPTLLVITTIGQAPGTVTYNISIPPSLLGNCNVATKRRLVFTWNSSTSVANPPTAIDSISVVSSAATAGTSTFSINNTIPTSGTNFNTFTEAISWVNAASYCGLSGPVVFNVQAGQNFNEDVPPVTASGTSVNTITFRKSGSGANPQIRPIGLNPAGNAGASDYGICLQGADYVTFDGIDVMPTNANIEYGYLIRIASETNGSQYNTIKNAKIVLGSTNTNSRGIFQTAVNSFNFDGGNGTSANSSSGTNSYNKYQNLTIGGSYWGIVLYGSGSAPAEEGNEIGTTAINIFNTIGRPEVPNDIGGASATTAGIFAYYQKDIKVFNNKVSNVTSGASTDGIVLGYNSTSFVSATGGIQGFNNQVYNNIISNIRGSSTSSTSAFVNGIRIQHDVNQGVVSAKIYNNVINKITTAYAGASASATRLLRGIYLMSNDAAVTVIYELVNNTVVMDGSASPNISSICFESASTRPVHKIRNNLFANNTGAQTGVSMHYALGIIPTSSAQAGANLLGASGSLSNFNDFYIANTANGHVGAYVPTGTAVSPLSTLANWKTNFSSPALDVNSISADPVLNPGDVLFPFYTSPLVSACPSLSTPYNIDIMGVTRKPNTATIGAYERAGDIIPPVIRDTTLLGENNLLNRSLPGLLTITDNGEVNVTSGYSPRIYFKKSTELNVFGTNANGTNGWKWVEANNLTSPFGFEIDYTLLNTPLALHDTIQYFYVAQDTVTGTMNVTALPSAGFAGTSVGNITQAPTTPKSYVIYDAQATFVSAVLKQGITAKVITGSENQQIVRVAVQTAGGDPAYVTSFTFDHNAANGYGNIKNAKVWFTGTDTVFATTKLFGTTGDFVPTSGAIGNFTINGQQAVDAGTNYFWLSYDIRTSGTPWDSVDADLVSVTYRGNVQAAATGTDAGSRIIKAAYCVPAFTQANYCISNVTFNTLNSSTSTCTTPSYTVFTPAGALTTSVRKGLRYNLSVTTNSSSAGVVVFIDYNDNGLFETNETIMVTPQSITGVATVVPVTIPCNAVTSSEVRMRVRSFYYSNAADACPVNTNGEAEDYTISIQDNPADYVSSSAIQYSGSVSANDVNKVVMRLKVVAAGCGVTTLSDINAHTGKTMNPSGNILEARLYATGNGTTFQTTKLVATATAINGPFTFTGFTDTLLSNPGDTNNYWIAYNIAALPSVNDTVDVRVDNINVGGQFRTPSNNDPAEFMLVKTANTYVSSDVIHPDLARVPRQGQLNTPVMRVRVITTNTGAPLQVTQFDLNTNGGGADTTNISAAKIYYTGNQNVFSTNTMFGSPYAPSSPFTATWDPYIITGSQYLNYDTNYFWLAYDIKPGAVLGDSVDAGLVSFTSGTTITPTTSTLAGNYKISKSFCLTTFIGLSSPNTFIEDISNVTFGSLTNASTCSTTGGPGSVQNIYSDYSEIVAAPNVLKGGNVPFSLTGVSNCYATTASSSTSFAIFIDWNKDGDFDDLDEVAYRSATAAGVAAGRTVTGNVAIPCHALTGKTRMRVVYAGSNNVTAVACAGNAWYGESEDYTINIQDNPISYVTTVASQTAGMVAPGMNNAQMMRVAVKAQGCGSSVLSEMHFNVTGSSNPATDIASAKLYTTGTSSVYSTSTLLGSVGVTGSALHFTGLNQALVSTNITDTNYFWLTYDVSNAAAVPGTLDAGLDSLYAIGSMRVISSNPTGNQTIANKMAFVSVSATHPDLSTVSLGTTNKRMLRVMIAGSSNSAPVDLTAISFSTNGGGNDLTNIDSAKVYFTAKSTTFAATKQFGSSYAGTTNPWGAFTITGLQQLTADTNYFWLVYDVKATAAIFDSLDAELTSIEFDGATQVPSGSSGAPAGNVIIKNNYCASSGFGNMIRGYLNTTAFSMGSLSTTSASCSATLYTDNTALAPATIQKGTNATFSLTSNNCTSNILFEAYTRIYIDYDQNGDFAGANELVYNSSLPIGTNPGSFAVPCGVKTGLTRMRVIITTSATASSCGNTTVAGETEDYQVMVADNPVAYGASVASQDTGRVAAGAADQVIMRLKVKANGCGVARLENLYFNTGASTNASADIFKARLYATGTTGTFNTSKPLGEVIGPVGAFSFSNVFDTLSADTQNYWLVYDVNAFATPGNVLDVVVDSVMVLGGNYIPANNNPAAFKTVDAPMTYIGTEVSHPQGWDRVIQGSSNNRVLNVRVIMSSTGAASKITRLNLGTNGGGIDTANIASARVYYTGNSSVFATTTPFGSAYTPAPAGVASGKWLPYAINGLQTLINDTNYFWVVYDLKAGAAVGDSVDAELLSLIVDNTPQTPAVTAPAGNSLIRLDYCVPGIVSGRCIDSVVIGSIRNGSGTSCASPYYTLYPKTPTTTTDVYAGSTVPVYLTFASATKVSIFIDLNRNGSLNEPGEEFDLTGSIQVPFIRTSILIPANAIPGETRMRIRTYGGQPTGIVTSRACSDWNQSESEDYTINIMPAIPPTTYVWNQVAPGDFNVAANWTPARTASSATDRLVFDGTAGELTVNNAFSQSVKTIEVTPNTRLNLNAAAAVTIAATDSLILGQGVYVKAGSNITMQIGESTGSAGLLDAASDAGISAPIKRWVSTSNSGDLLFPISDDKGLKRVTINYTAAPSPGMITASFIHAKSLGEAGFPLYESGAGVFVNTVAKEGHWNIETSEGLAGGIYNATFVADSISGINSYFNLVIVNRADAFSDWSLNGTHTPTFGSNDRPVLGRSGMNLFGEFTVASDSALNPLPVTLLSFKASVIKNDVLLHWSTATEKSNKGFVIERSVDGKTFERVDFVKGNGNSNYTSNYSFPDLSAFAKKGAEKLYYRLRQVDMDGKETVSSVVAVSKKDAQQTPFVVYPNPFSDLVRVDVVSLTNADANITITDMTGKVIRQSAYALKQGYNTLDVSGVDHLQNGVYFITVDVSGEKQVQKLLKY